MLSRAVEGDLLDEYRSPELSAVDPDFAAPDPRVTPIDHGEVCLNVDRGWFASHGVAPPTSLADLTLSRYRNLLVVENPATSSPGLAFLLATVATFGDRWEGYWRGLRANGVRVVDGWEEAYTQQFSGAAGSPGKRPIVVSYATSPAAEVIFASKPLTVSPTAAVEDGCYRQVEYAGILRGARNEDGAKKLIDFMLSERFQADVPGSMFVYPVRAGVDAPRGVREARDRRRRPAPAPRERDRREPRPLGRPVDRHRRALTRAATVARPGRVPRGLLRMAARRDPRAKPRRRRLARSSLRRADEELDPRGRLVHALAGDRVDGRSR